VNAWALRRSSVGCRPGPVVLVSGDSAARAFLVDVLDEHFPEEGPPLELTSGVTSAAVVGGSRRCRLVVIDGEPPDISASALIEAIRVADRMIPVLLIRYSPDRGMDAKPPLEGVCIERGPLVRSGIEERLVSLLGCRSTE